MRDLKDKIVVVTGASRGIGLAISREFARAGARVVLAARTIAKLNEEVSRLEGGAERHLTMQCDVTKSVDIHTLIATVKKDFGRIDIWVNNAGIGARKPFLETTEFEFDDVMDTNFRAVYYSMKELIPIFKEQKESDDKIRGQIINIASSVIRGGSPNVAIYAASKAAMVMLTESVASEVRNDGIKISVLAPGSTDTRLRDEFAGASDGKQRLTPSEVAEAVVSLARQNANAWTAFADIRPLVLQK